MDAAYSEMCALFEAALIEAERNGDFRCAKHLIHMSLTFYRIGIHIYLYILLRLFFKLIIFEVGAGWSDSEAQDYIQNTLRRSELITIWKKQVFWDELFYGTIKPHKFLFLYFTQCYFFVVSDSVIEEREKVNKELLAGAAWRKNVPEELINQEKSFIFGQLGSYGMSLPTHASNNSYLCMFVASTMLGYGVTVEDTESFIKKQCDTYGLSEEFRALLLVLFLPLTPFPSLIE